MLVKGSHANTHRNAQGGAGFHWSVFCFVSLWASLKPCSRREMDVIILNLEIKKLRLRGWNDPPDGSELRTQLAFSTALSPLEGSLWVTPPLTLWVLWTLLLLGCHSVEPSPESPKLKVWFRKIGLSSYINLKELLWALLYRTIPTFT